MGVELARKRRRLRPARAAGWRPAALLSPSRSARSPRECERDACELSAPAAARAGAPPRGTSSRPGTATRAPTRYRDRTALEGEQRRSPRTPRARRSRRPRGGRTPLDRLPVWSRSRSRRGPSHEPTRESATGQRPASASASERKTKNSPKSAPAPRASPRPLAPGDPLFWHERDEADRDPRPARCRAAPASRDQPATDERERDGDGRAHGRRDRRDQADHAARHRGVEQQQPDADGQAARDRPADVARASPPLTRPRPRPQEPPGAGRRPARPPRTRTAANRREVTPPMKSAPPTRNADASASSAVTLRGIPHPRRESPEPSARPRRRPYGLSRHATHPFSGGRPPLTRLSGTVAAAVTPLREGGRELDLDALGPFADFLAGGGLDGVLRLRDERRGDPVHRRRARAGALEAVPAPGRACRSPSTPGRSPPPTLPRGPARRRDRCRRGRGDRAAVLRARRGGLAAGALCDGGGTWCAPLPFYVYEFAITSGYAVPPAVVFSSGCASARRTSRGDEGVRPHVGAAGAVSDRRPRRLHRLRGPDRAGDGSGCRRGGLRPGLGVSGDRRRGGPRRGRRSGRLARRDRAFPRHAAKKRLVPRAAFRSARPFDRRCASSTPTTWSACWSFRARADGA